MASAVLAPGVLLTTLLSAACVSDLRSRRIPNGLVAATFALALACAAHPRPPAPFAVGIPAALAGAAFGLALWLPLYALGALAAGDVKLFAAAAAWLGPAGVLPASAYAALAGGVLALVWVAAGTVRGHRDAARARGLPYGLAVTAGALAVAWGGS
jgi:prepilin peptidase CpaA